MTKRILSPHPLLRRMVYSPNLRRLDVLITAQFAVNNLRYAEARPIGRVMRGRPWAGGNVLRWLIQ